MTPENTPKLDRCPGPAVRLAPAPTPQARGKKGRSPALTNIKLLIAGGALATTVGGWALLAQHDALSAQVIVEPTPIVAYEVPQTTAEATLTPTPTALSLALAAQPTATAEAAATVSVPQIVATDSPAAAATDTPQATSTPEATSTAIVAQPTATAVTKTTTTTKTVTTTTRSSR